MLVILVSVCWRAGIAAAELALMTSKSRTQLLQALQQHQTPLPKDMPPGLLPPRLTATCWAAASWQEVCAAAGEGPSSVRPAGRKGGAAGDRTTYHGFDLCIGDGTVHEGEAGALMRKRLPGAALAARLLLSLRACHLCFVEYSTLWLLCEAQTCRDLTRGGRCGQHGHTRPCTHNSTQC